jgi:mono/diheme cytochrome c family protein
LSGRFYVFVILALVAQWPVSGVAGDESPGTPKTPVKPAAKIKVTAKVKPVANIMAKATLAAPVFSKYCERCHGSNGSGNGSTSLSSPLPNFTSAAWHHGVTDAQLVVTILEGKGTRMPAFAGKVSDTQARNLVAFIRSLGPASAVPVSVPDSDFEQQFQQLHEEWLELQKQFDMLSKTPPKK